MDITIYAVPRFSFRISKDHLDLLIHAASKHYDARCRGLASVANGATGALNGLLTQWHWQFDFHEGHPATSEVQANRSDLDTLLKVLEMAPHLYSGTTQRDVQGRQSIRQLNEAFLGALRLAGQKVKEWEAVYEGPAMAHEAPDAPVWKSNAPMPDQANLG